MKTTQEMPQQIEFRARKVPVRFFILNPQSEMALSFAVKVKVSIFVCTFLRKTMARTAHAPYL